MSCLRDAVSSKGKAEVGRIVVRWLILIAVTLPWLTRGSVDAQLAVEDFEIIGEAIHAKDMDEWPRAFRLMSDIEDPLASKLFRWFVLLDEKGDVKFDEVANFILESPTWPRINELQILAESRLTDSADQALTLKLFEAREPITTRGQIRFAEALFATNRPEEAVQQIKSAWTHGEFTAKEEKSFLKRHGRHLSRYDHETRMDNMLWDRRRSAAKRMLPRVSKDRQKLGKARLALQQRASGVDQAIKAVPEELLDDAGLTYDRIRWRRQKRKHEDAVTLLLDPPEQLGRPERWWFERSYQIRRAIDQRDFDVAYRLASHHGQLNGGDYAEAEWLSGWLALRFNHRPKTAFRHFVRLYDRVIAPVRQARAAYWAGRAAGAQGDDLGAVAWYRRAASHHLTYYGQLAADELDEATLIRQPVDPTEAERLAFGGEEVAGVARMLIAAGAANHLDDFLLALSEQAETATEISLIAELAIAGGRPSLLARVGRYAAFNGNIYDPAAFPIPRIEGLLNPSAEAVEPPLLFSLARQESMFRFGASSNAGARGLLQLLPSTARIVARKIGEDYDLERLVGDPNYNALLGGHYLGLMLERFEGERALALAAYNAGPLRVKRWIEKHGDPRTGHHHDVIDWIELIPFDETRNYVQRVLEGYHVYKRRLAGTDIALVDYPGTNALHPPPIPMLKPRNGAAADAANTVQETVAEAPVHRPQFKPRDVELNASVDVAGEQADRLEELGNGSQDPEASFDDQERRRIAAEEGDPAETSEASDEQVPKL
ncbi:MAG: transglycosylase SLT domain-containing protein [Geminicoccaceae bacterium]